MDQSRTRQAKRPSLRPRTTRLFEINDHIARSSANGLELIDTGSPVSMPIPREAKEAVDPRLTHLIGMDELGRSPFVLDWTAATLVQSAPRPRAAASSPLQSVMSIPAIAVTVHIAGQPAPATAFLDTGAPIGYAAAAAVRGLTSIGDKEDFFPGLGRFTTPVYEVEVEALGLRQHVRVGVLPPLLAMALSLLGPDTWILGADFFRGRRLWFDTKNGEIAQAIG